MKKPRTSSAKIYLIAYIDKNGEKQQTYFPSQNAQQAVDTLRRVEENAILITTVARVVGNWK